MKPSPPNIALKFLRWFCREDYLEEIEGDLIEVFEYQHETSPTQAATKFYWSVIRYFRPEFIKVFTIGQNSTTMIKHNLKLTFRNFKKYKSSFLINLIGLSSGLACSLMIYLWVTDELGVDKFHEKDHRLYQIMHNAVSAGTVNTLEWTPGPLAKSLTEVAPEVEYSVATFPPGAYTFSGVLSSKENRLKARYKYVDKDFFNMFSYQLSEGNKDRLLHDKQAIVISEKIAFDLFQTTENITGRTIKLDQGEFAGDYFVSGVFEDVDEHSSIQFDVLFNYALYESKHEEMTRWEYNSPSAYVTLHENADVDQFAQRIAKIIQEHEPNSESTLFLRKYSDQYLHANYENGKPAGGRINYIILFVNIGGFILIIACINFINLSTARASRRYKEIGVKKCIGAKRSIFISQYLGESLIISSLSAILALAIIYFSLPAFNQITGKHLMLLFDLDMILSLLGIVLITGLIAGSYPALLLSGFKPVAVLKGNNSNAGISAWVRKGLVTFQFVISIILIVMVIIVHRQVEFIQAKNLGYEKDNVIEIFAGQIDESTYETSVIEMERIPGVLSVTSMNGDLTSGLHNTTPGVSWDGLIEGNEIKFTDLAVGFNFFETLGAEIVAGRSFSKSFSTEDDKIIFNESAIKQMGLRDPIGQTVKLWGRDKQIIGIVKDVHVESLYKKVEPTFFRLSDKHMNMYVKVKTGYEKEALAGMQQFYTQQSNGLTLDYKFLDEVYRELYESEQKVSVLSRYFAAMAILISCLGLFALAAFTADRRMKEISIRKILGSSAQNIVLLLSRDFTKIVLVSVSIALPISYFIAQEWLNTFAYSIQPSWWIFILAGITTLAIAWITVGLQTVKAASNNPLDSLKQE